MKNKFCDAKDLSNEASVEARFVDRLIDCLDFLPADVKLKTSLRELKVGKGSKSSLYKPDYAILSGGMPTVIVDAKSTSETISEYEQQCSSYCLEINKAYDHNPVQYYLLSNGLKTALYKWDLQKPILELDFADFKDGNSKFEKLIKTIGKKALAEEASEQIALVDNTLFGFEKVIPPVTTA
jgi:type I restriction enzyme M protein